MKMEYQPPQLTVCVLSVKDVIATSLRVASVNELVEGEYWNKLPNANA